MQDATLLRAGTLVLVFALALGGCGGTKRAANGAANAMQNAAQNAGTTASRTINGGATGADTGSPDMNCGAVKPVWVNTKSGTYHEPGDPYYGHTKQGKYMCPSAAHSAGYHAARSGHSKQSETTQQ
jgi:hypothetical protein